MSSERPFGDSGTEHHPEPDHPRPTEEATASVPTPNRFWRMMIDPGFPSPTSNPAPFMVTTEAFLGLISQVQALAGMVQTIISYLPQLVHSMAHQSAPSAAPPQMESPMAPDRGIPPDVEAPQPRVAEARPASPTPTPTQSQRNPRHSSIPGHPSIPDGAEAVKVLMVADRATADDFARDATTGTPVYGGRNANSWQAGGDEAPLGGTVSWTSGATSKEEGRQVGLVASQTPLDPPLIRPEQRSSSKYGKRGS
ncbi:hypothetical protein B296_00045657 [Ensete ventricosum]|uniref:Uncharacterized protein n=1 Tax=Ensete ventricosum TaxID=4639 RepID=A0A426WWF5_ENSVE|nr:hypothetical protein B296_00045657 [Ensete ventricosum]